MHSASTSSWWVGGTQQQPLRSVTAGGPYTARSWHVTSSVLVSSDLLPKTEANFEDLKTMAEEAATAIVPVASSSPLTQAKMSQKLNGAAQIQVQGVALRLDLGCGTNKRQDNGPWTGVDSVAFPGVDVVCDLAEPIYAPMPAGFEQLAGCLDRKVIGRKRWPWADCSVAEAHTSHFLEHLTEWERVHFVNELYRVLVPGGKCTIIVPHWASTRAYGDPSHKWPAVSEFWFNYLWKAWRLGDPSKGIGPNAPHTDASVRADGFSCDFDWVLGYAYHPYWQSRNQETQQFAAGWYKEAVSDTFATITKAVR